MCVCVRESGAEPEKPIRTVISGADCAAFQTTAIGQLPFDLCTGRATSQEDLIWLALWQRGVSE